MAPLQQRLGPLLRRCCAQLPELLLIASPLALSAVMLSLMAPALRPARQVQPDAPVVDELLAETAAAPAPSTAPPDLAVPLRRSPEPAIEIRVLLQQDGLTLVSSSGGGVPLQFNDGRPWKIPGPKEPISCRDGALNLAEVSGPGELWLQPRPGLAVVVGANRYRGRLRLICRNQQLHVINHIPLEDYIASVVGAEMPSHWPEQALQAQAIAARSYAMAHLARPADRHWNLGDTTRWQAYHGLGSESTRGRQAAQATRGLILSVDGGIVESLYAATRQLTVEAHGRLGASMSQHGARELAEKGYRYSQILATYYPGASLSRLERR